jgi:hypothetical protein
MDYEIRSRERTRTNSLRLTPKKRDPRLTKEGAAGDLASPAADSSSQATVDGFARDAFTSAPSFPTPRIVAKPSAFQSPIKAPASAVVAIGGDELAV